MIFLLFFSRCSLSHSTVLSHTHLITHIGPGATHTHEEADTLIPHQVLASVANGTMREIYVWSPDTDVLLLLLDLVSCGHLASPT